MRTSFAYRVGIVLVSLAMILLPLAYLGLIALIGWLVGQHLIHHTGLIGAGRGRGAVMALLLYLVPLIAGGLCILFLVKPLVTRRAREQEPYVLKPSREPLLFAFVKRICQDVGAPVPTQIRVDNEVNASASFRKGIWSMTGNDLVLTIGLPLVAGTTMRQLGGVLAHEFGHFSQGAGMRLSYLIRSINYWFYRVVYERDAWDERLDDWTRNTDGQLNWIGWACRAMVVFSRAVLWIFMMMGNGISGFLLRQMEFDADRHEARWAGSETFRQTQHAINRLSFSQQMAYRDLEDFYREGRLADNLSELVSHRARHLDPEILKALANQSLSQSTSFFDTHPSDRDRAANAMLEKASGKFHLELPAVQLFTQFEQVAKNVTLVTYRTLFGDRFRINTVHATARLLARQHQEMQGHESVHRFVLGQYDGFETIMLPRFLLGKQDQVDDLKSEIEQCREMLGQVYSSFRAHTRKLERVQKQWVQVHQFLALNQATLTPQKNLFHQTFKTPVAAHKRLAELDEQRNSEINGLAAFRKLAGTRLIDALELLRSQRILDRAALTLEAATRAHQLLKAARFAFEQSRLLDAMRLDSQRLICLLEHLNQDVPEMAAHKIRTLMETLFQALAELRQAARLVEYPFDHGRGQITLGKYLIHELPEVDDPVQILQTTDTMFDQMEHFMLKVFGELCTYAEKVESALGLNPLSLMQDKHG